MKRTLVALALAIAVALAWTLAGDPGEQANVPEPSPVPEAEWEGTSAEVDLIGLLQETEAEAPTGRTEVVEGLPADSAALASDAALEAATAGSIEVLVLALETGVPLPGVSLYVKSADGATGTRVEWVAGKQGASPPTTDEQGRASFLVSPGRPIRIRARTYANGASTQRELEPLARGEVRRVHLDLPTRPGANLVGRVIEMENGEPIAGARVRFLVTMRLLGFNGGMESFSDTTQESRTGPDGWFELPLASWRQLSGRVDAEGFGTRLFLPEQGHEDRERAIVVKLQRGATLRGVLLGTQDPAGYRVLVNIRGHELLESSRMLFRSIGEVRRTTSVAEDGTWELTDLPPDAGLQLKLWSDMTLVRSGPELLRLRPGEERSLEWRLGSGTTLRGRALIADTGEALSRHSIWLLAGTQASGLMRTYQKPVARTKTDREGRFTFPDLPPGEWSVGPAPVRSSWVPAISVTPVLGKAEIAPVATQVTILEGAATVDVELRLYRGLFIRGEVLEPDGRPAKSASVGGFCDECGISANGHARDGVFRLGPLVPGTYRLTASGGSEGATDSESVTARVGDVGIVLQLRAGASIQGQLVDAATGLPIRGTVRLIPEESQVGVSTMGLTKADGSFHFKGLDPGSYDVSGTAGDLIGKLQGVQLAALQPVQDLEVLLEPGAILLVTYSGQGEKAAYRVTSGDWQLHRDGLVRGRASRSVMTAGEVVVTVWFTGLEGEKRKVQRTVDLVAGEETKVEIGDE